MTEASRTPIHAHGAHLVGPLLGGRSAWIRFGAGSLAVLAVTLARYELGSIVGTESPLLPFVLAVLVAGYLGGLGPAVLATLLSPLLCTALFVNWPSWISSGPPTAEIIQWAAHVTLFVSVGGLVSWIVHSLQISHREQQDRSQRLAILSDELLERERRVRETEQRLRVLEASLREADQRKDQFLATLAHELRNPLAPIRYAVKLLTSDTPGATHGRAREMIERQATQMARLLDDLLDVSRITRNMIELRREVLDLRDIIEQATTAARPVIDGMHHQLQLTLAGEPLWVDGDATRLHQIIDNLLHNAVKYTDPGGRIEVGAYRRKESVVLSVRDTGAGLAPDMIDRVFELFTQMQHERRARGGLGIGLAVVKRLVELHSGSIAAESPGLGRGSLFRVTFPLATRHERVEAGRASENVIPLFKNDARILLVDDNTDITESLSLLLRGHGYSVHTAEDGAAAIRIAEVLQPDIVVLDLGMPDPDGYAVARWIRQQPWGVRARIVAVTGWGQPEERRRTQEAGFNAHLVKPVDGDQLLQIIATMSRPAAASADTPQTAR